jgi:hypothetical protein
MPTAQLTPRAQAVIAASDEYTAPIFRAPSVGCSGNPPDLISVDKRALRQLLEAVTGPGHHIRELQATRSLHALGYPNPIDTLIDSYNAAIAAQGQQA